MDGGGGGLPTALEKNAAELTVMDVYDIASAVGQEFERVIDQHGCEAIARLMPKVVRVLEILEVLVSRNHINPEMEELRLELDRLRLERMDRIEKERKHQKVGGRREGWPCHRAAVCCLFSSFPPGSFLPPSFSPPLPCSPHFRPLAFPRSGTRRQRCFAPGRCGSPPFLCRAGGDVEARLPGAFAAVRCDLRSVSELRSGRSAHPDCAP